VKSIVHRQSAPLRAHPPELALPPMKVISPIGARMMRGPTLGGDASKTLIDWQTACLVLMNSVRNAQAGELRSSARLSAETLIPPR